MFPVTEGPLTECLLYLDAWKSNGKLKNGWQFAFGHSISRKSARYSSLKKLRSHAKNYPASGDPNTKHLKPIFFSVQLNQLNTGPVFKYLT